VIVNEFGEISLDHQLIKNVTGSVLELANGCLCCTVRTDLMITLRKILYELEIGALKKVEHIILETSGLADPAPILSTIASDSLIEQTIEFHSMISVVDTVSGLCNLKRFNEAVRQVALADKVLISKQDLTPFNEELRSHIKSINSTTTIENTQSLDISTWLINCDTNKNINSLLANQDHSNNTHSHNIQTYSFQLNNFCTRLEFAKALGSLAHQHGHFVLRVKGLVRFNDFPDKLAVVHAVQHKIFQPVWLENDTDSQENSILTFIVQDLPRQVIESFFQKLFLTH
jgi:G3E family GTPase